MRCLSCNKNLTDFEATRRSAMTNEFIDLCNYCFASVSEDINSLEREDLAHDEDYVIDNSSHCGLDFDNDY
jgi:transposase-like protein